MIYRRVCQRCIVSSVNKPFLRFNQTRADGGLLTRIHLCSQSRGVTVF